MACHTPPLKKAKGNTNTSLLYFIINKMIYYVLAFFYNSTLYYTPGRGIRFGSHDIS